MQRAPPEHVIRAPHYTALRPVVLVGSEAAAHSPFPEQLLIRGLAATLLAHLQPAENMDIQVGTRLCRLSEHCMCQQVYLHTTFAYCTAAAQTHGGVKARWSVFSTMCVFATQASGLQGFEHLVQPGCACTDLLWYEPMQPYAARDSPLLAR